MNLLFQKNRCNEYWERNLQIEKKKNPWDCDWMMAGLSRHPFLPSLSIFQVEHSLRSGSWVPPKNQTQISFAIINIISVPPGFKYETLLPYILCKCWKPQQMNND